MLPPTEITTIRQPPRSKLCGACVCAMVTGKTLDQVLSEMDWRRFTDTGGVAEYLARHDILFGMCLYGPLDITAPVNLEGGRIPLSICGVKSKLGNGRIHWVVWDGNRFHDPAGDEPEYEIVDVFPLTYMQPMDPMPEWARDLPERWEDSLLEPAEVAS
jgi:hypothetical protein